MTTLPDQAETTDGRFHVTFELDRTSLAPDEALTGTATLSLISGGPVAVGRSGSGFFGFRYTELDGTLDIQPVMTADCASDTLVVGQAKASGLNKSGGIANGDPDASYLATFFSEPAVHLRPGTWRVTAVAMFIERADCTGAQHSIEVPLTVHVGP